MADALVDPEMRRLLHAAGERLYDLAGPQGGWELLALADRWERIGNWFCRWEDEDTNPRDLFERTEDIQAILRGDYLWERVALYDPTDYDDPGHRWFGDDKRVHLLDSLGGISLDHLQAQAQRRVFELEMISNNMPDKKIVETYVLLPPVVREALNKHLPKLLEPKGDGPGHYYDGLTHEMLLVSIDRVLEKVDDGRFARDSVRDPGAPVRDPDPEAPRTLHHLEDGELLEIVVGKAAAKRLLTAAGSLQLLAQWNLPELVNRGGLPEKKARVLHAALVAGKRGFNEPMPSDWSINSPDDVARFMTEKIGHDRRREHFVVLLVDSTNRLIRYVELSQGTINATLVHPRDVLAAAIQDHAVGIIVGHNHPSGQAVPSPEDKALTNRLGQAAQAVGIGLRDHVIVTPDGRFYSFADHGEMPSQNPRAVF